MNDALPGIAVQPESGRHDTLVDAVRRGGGRVVPVGEAEGLVWADPSRPEALPGILADGPGVRWVALPFSGIEPYRPFLDHDRTWTCARGVYARPVAEHALALGLAGLRGLVGYAQADRWTGPVGANLLDARVAVLGAGGITEELLRLLAPFGCHTTVVRRRPDPLPGADRTVALDDRVEALRGARLVVVALALTPETEGCIGAEELAVVEPGAWLVNVARGGHVQVPALLEALDDGPLGGAALDVTDPEPLPAGHPLWGRRDVIITPHVGNTPEMGEPLLADHIARNVERFADRRPLEGVVDVDAGY